LASRVIVREFLSRLLLAVHAGPDAERFCQGGLSGWRRAKNSLYPEERRDIPTGWLVFEYQPIKRWDLMDYLVEHFDADVDWPDYQWGLDNLRKRRCRLKRAAATGWNGRHQETSAPSRLRYPRHIVAAYAVLRCPLGANMEAVRRAYRERSMESHPDRGGSTEQMSRVNRAVEIVRDFLSAAEKAPARAG